MILHGGLVAWRRGGLWCGALIQGASGTGKSDLALRAADGGACIVADDRVLLWRSGDRLYGRAPDVLGGRTEVRGLQVVGCPHIRLAEVVLSVRCEPPDTSIERVYGGEEEAVLDVSLPCVRLHPCEASAPAKLRRAFDRLGRRAPAS